jgi:hypothetical protein
MSSTSIYKSITPTYLYIKQHSITGLKYFGKTTCSDPYKYQGSGSYWKKHCKKHGKEHVITLWISDLYTDTSIVDVALHFSIENEIVNSKEWANLILENGLDGAPAGHDGHIFSEKEKEKISISSKTRWENEDYKKQLSNIHKNRWSPELKEKQSKRLKETFWTEDRKRLHSDKLKGHVGHTKCKGVSKPESHGKNVSKALKGVPKSENHKQKLRTPKPKIICRIYDKKEMSSANYANWVKRFISHATKKNC